MAKTPKDPSNPKSPSSQEQNKADQERAQLNAKFAKYTGSALKVAAVILIFFYIGHWLDGKLGFEKPWLGMVGSLIGVAAGIYSLIRDLQD